MPRVINGSAPPPRAELDDKMPQNAFSKKLRGCNEMNFKDL